MIKWGYHNVLCYPYVVCNLNIRRKESFIYIKNIMTEESQHISLSVAMQELFKKSNELVYWSYGVQGFLFTINILIILLKPDKSNEFIWLFFAFSLVIIILSMIVIYHSKKYYSLGESIRKMDMVERIFPNAKNSSEKSYLLSKIPSTIINKAENRQNENTDYYSSREDKYGKLIENVQENSFFTSEIMRFYSKIILGVIGLILILICTSSIYGFYILSESNTNKDLTINIAEYLALLINFLYVLNIIDHYILFNKKSKELKRIDEDLNKIKSNPQEDDIITFFTEYNCILNDALPCPNFAYKIIKNKLNIVWNNRIDNE